MRGRDFHGDTSAIIRCACFLDNALEPLKRATRSTMRGKRIFTERIMPPPLGGPPIGSRGG